jgi:hypothetical protein
MSEFYCEPEVCQVSKPIEKKEEICTSIKKLSIDERFEIISSIGEEIIDVEGLVKLLVNIESYNNTHPDNEKKIL